MISSPVEVMARPDQPRESGRNAGILLQLDQLRTEVRTLREQERVDAGDTRAPVIETQKALENLQRGIDMAKQGAPEWDALEAEQVARKVTELELAFKKENVTPPYSVTKLLTEVGELARHILYQRRNSPGPALEAVQDTANVVGGRYGAGIAGGVIGTSVATTLSTSSLAAGLGVVGGTALGIVGVPLAVETLARKIENPKARAVVRTLLYGGAGVGAALLAPTMIYTILISLGITGTVHLLHWLAQRGKAPAPESIPELRDAARRVAPQPT